MFARLDVKRNVWEQLTSLTELTNNTLYDRFVLVARRDNLFLIHCGTQLEMYNVTMNEWHFQTERDVHFAPIKSNCFRSNCNCKLYFKRPSRYQHYWCMT